MIFNVCFSKNPKSSIKTLAATSYNKVTIYNVNSNFKVNQFNNLYKKYIYNYNINIYNLITNYF